MTARAIEAPVRLRTTSRSGRRSAISTPRGSRRASTASTAIAWRRPACSPPSPNSSRPTARKPPRVSPRASPAHPQRRILPRGHGPAVAAIRPARSRRRRRDRSDLWELGSLERIPADRIGMRSGSLVCACPYRKTGSHFSGTCSGNPCAAAGRAARQRFRASGRLAAVANRRSHPCCAWAFCWLLTLVASAGALAQTAPNQSRPTGHVLPLPPASVAEVITDLSRRRRRSRAPASLHPDRGSSGDLAQFAALVNEATPVFSFTDEKDPIAFWKANYPTPTASRCSRSPP